MMRRFGLRDDQWERIKDLLPGREGSVGVTAADESVKFVDGRALSLARTGDAVARSAGAARCGLEERADRRLQPAGLKGWCVGVGSFSTSP